MRRFDVKLFGNGSSSMFGHSDASLMAYRGRYKSIYPFPYTVLTPFLLRLFLTLEDEDYKSLQLHLDESSDALSLALKEGEREQERVKIMCLKSRLKPIIDFATSSWCPDFNIFFPSSAVKSLMKLMHW